MDASDAAAGERVVMVRSGESCWWPAAMARTQARRTEWLSSSSATGKGGMLPSCQLGSPPSTRRRGRHAPRWLSNPLEAAAASERSAGGSGELPRPSASALSAMLMLRVRESRAGRQCQVFSSLSRCCYRTGAPLWFLPAPPEPPGGGLGAYPLKSLSLTTISMQAARPVTPWSGRATIVAFLSFECMGE